MAACVSGRIETTSTARPVIHASVIRAAKQRRFEAIWRWVCALVVPRHNGDDRESLSLHIDNLQGHRVHAINHGGPLIDVALLAGTYQVTALLGDVQRGYIVALAPELRLTFTCGLLPIFVERTVFAVGVAFFDTAFIGNAHSIKA